MIVAKQMIETNQVLSVGSRMEAFYWKNLRKTSNESAAITEAICQMCYTK